MSNSISVEPEMKANNNQIISGAFKSISLFFSAKLKWTHVLNYA